MTSIIKGVREKLILADLGWGNVGIEPKLLFSHNNKGGGLLYEPKVKIACHNYWSTFVDKFCFKLQ